MVEYDVGLNLIDRMSRPLAEIETKMMALEIRSSDLQVRMLRTFEPAAIESACGAVEAVSEEVKNTDTLVGKLGGRLKKMFPQYTGLQGLEKLVGLADTMNQTQARVDAVNDGLQTTDQLMGLIYDSSQRTRTSYEETANQVAQLGGTGAFAGNEEAIAFTESMSMLYATAGASSAEIEAATAGLANGLSAGALSGADLNAVLTAAPDAVRMMADYLSVPIERVTELAAAGQITADVMRGSILSATDEIRQGFDQVPYTWEQMMTMAQNTMINVLEPLLQVIGAAAQFVAENWDVIAPVLLGLATAIGLVTAAQLGHAAADKISAGATWLADMSFQNLKATLINNPFTWIALLIGVIVGVIYKWVQSVGGLRNAWDIVCAALQLGVATVKVWFLKLLIFQAELMTKLLIGWETLKTNILNIIGDMGVGLVMRMQENINGVIGLINTLIGAINKVTGSNISMIGEVTFGTELAERNEAAKQARNDNLDALKAGEGVLKSYYDGVLNAAQADVDQYRQQLDTAQQTGREAAEAKATGGYTWADQSGAGDLAMTVPENGLSEADLESYSGYSATAAVASGAEQIGAETASGYPIQGIATDTSLIADKIDEAAVELKDTAAELKYLRELAQKQASASNAPRVVNVNMGGVTNKLGADANPEAFVSRLAQMIEQTLLVGPEGVHA